jgi:endonuclease YncB( thermonuclease family)
MVTDGDTIGVEPASGGEQVKIRLHGIDAPKRNQPFGEAARGLVLNAVLYCHVLEHFKVENTHSFQTSLERFQV